MRRLRVDPNVVGLIVAVVLGAASFWGARQYLATAESAAEARLAGDYARAAVIVANEDLAAGTLLTADRLATRRVPARFLPSSAARPEDRDRVEGQQLVHALRRGDPIVWPVLAGGEAKTFSSALEAGRRAITFPVDEVNAIAGLLVPGDVIDLLYAAEAGPDGRRLTVRPLLQQVQVLATGTTTRVRRVRGTDGVEREVAAQFTTVTLHVTPDEAQRIVLAQRTGELTAVLRNPNDAARLANAATDSRSLSGEPSAGPPRRVRVAPAPYVELIVGGRGGGERSRVAVDDARDRNLDRLLALAVQREERQVSAATPTAAAGPEGGR